MNLNMHQFPPLYAKWLSDVLETPPPRESLATCDDCALCPKPDGRIPTAVFHFDPDVKCCFYMPRLPNFLVGRVLADDSPQGAAGRKTVAQRVATGPITPLGLDRPPEYQAQVQDFARALQNSRALRCPHFLDERGGVCGIYAHRDSMCTTYYCQHERGKVGMTFWRAVRRLLAQVELDLSLWAAVELGIDAVGLQRFLVPAGDDDGMLMGRTGPQPIGQGGGDGTWGEWAGRETAFYLAAAERVGALSWADVQAIGGMPVRVRELVVRQAHFEVDHPSVPANLRVGQFGVYTTRKEGLRVVTFSSLEAVDLPANLVALLPQFDGRPTETVLDHLRTDFGVEIEPEFLQYLVDRDILVAV